MEMLQNEQKKGTKSVPEATTEIQWCMRREEWSVRRRREQRVSHLVLRNMIEIMQCILPSGEICSVSLMQ